MGGVRAMRSQRCRWRTENGAKHEKEQKMKSERVLFAHTPHCQSKHTLHIWTILHARNSMWRACRLGARECRSAQPRISVLTRETNSTAKVACV
jgi:hypothetical protein